MSVRVGEKNLSRGSRLASQACREMTKGDPGGQIFLSYPHMNNGLLFLLTTVFIF